MIHLRTQFKEVSTLSVRGAWFARPERGYRSSQKSPSNTRGVAAFTLLEVILAVSIAGALLAGAATLMVSVTNAWLERQDRHFFEDHVDGVTEFLQASFSIAGTEIALGDEDGSGGSTISETGNEIEADGSQVTVDISGNNNLESGNSMEGNTDASGEGSGRLFFREHNSTTGSMDSYGMSLGYRGGATTVTTAGGNNWTGLANIGNGEWGMWGHNNVDNGTLIMSGTRSASTLKLLTNL